VMAKTVGGVPKMTVATIAQSSQPSILPPLANPEAILRIKARSANPPPISPTRRGLRDSSRTSPPHMAVETFCVSVLGYYFILDMNAPWILSEKTHEACRK
jgi:hypothetical protein